ncbi:MAG: hypothetical protein WAV02_18680, partial [Stellaceae bacterium]
MVDARFHQARISQIGGRRGAVSLVAKWLCAAAIALGGAGLAGCAAPPPLPAPVYYSSQPIPNPPKRAPRPTAATPA